MATTITRKATGFRLNSDLLIQLKRQAKKENRSLNNFVETILFDAVYREPNDETIEAINEVKSGKYAGKLNIDSFDAFMKSVNEIE